jgi:Na+-transporting methylmalonyl-CoA/oxaloacetate decarboxylase gamma subunit
MPDLLAVGVFLFLVGVVVIVILGLAYSSRRDRAEKAEKVIDDVLAYARDREDVEPVAAAIVDIIRQARTHRS